MSALPPTSPFSNVDDELIAKSLAQSPFTTFGIENVRIKRCFRRTLELKTASNRVFGLQNAPF